LPTKISLSPGIAHKIIFGAWKSDIAISKKREVRAFLGFREQGTGMEGTGMEGIGMEGQIRIGVPH